jgi:hypothetical protein
VPSVACHGAGAHRRVLCGLLLGVALLAFPGSASPAGAMDVIPFTCNPLGVNWHFQASNNYAAPDPGGRYTKSKDGCQSVWLINHGALTTFDVVYKCGSGQCTTHAKACPTNVVCQLWENAENGVPFYVADTSKTDTTATIKF